MAKNATFAHSKVNYVKLLVIVTVIAILGAYLVLPKTLKTVREEKNINIFASDTYTRVADLHLTIPVVALLEPRYAFSPQVFSLRRWPDEAELERRAEFKLLSSSPDTAPLVDRVEISIRQYQYTGERTSSVRICPLLARDWARGFCTGELQEMMSKLPDKFYIVDKQRIDTFSGHWTVGRERVSDQIKSITLENSKSSIACDADGKFCTAITPVSERTLAVWTVWPSISKQLTAQQVADTQGAAIRAFVRNAIGQLENFGELRTGFASIE